MKYPFLRFVAIFILAPSWLIAQSSHGIIFKKNGDMTISVNPGGFPDSLMQTDHTTGISWLLANDANNLFVFLKATGKRIQNKILLHGITIAINAKGKKKAKPSLTFPVIDQEALMAQMNALSGANSELATNEFENMQKERINQFNEIRVDGFKKINNGDIPLSNQYGIDAKMLFDSAGNLLYEMTIPFQYINLSGTLKNDIAVNIKMNGFDFKSGKGNYSGTPGSWNGKGGMSRGGSGFHGRGNWHQDTNEAHSSGKTTTEAADLWIKAPLAQ